MRRFSWIGLAGAALALMVVGWINAEDPKNQEAKVTDPWTMLGNELGLDNQQMQQVHQMEEKFRAQAEPARKQVRELRHQEFEAIRGVLTEQQKADLPKAMHAMWDKEWKAIGAKLNLNNQQQQDIENIRAEFGKKFRDLAKQNQGNMPEQADRLKGEFFKSIEAKLDAKQRAELPVVLHEEFGQWKNPQFRKEHLKTMGDELKLSDAQRKQIEQIRAGFEPKLQAPMQQLQQVHQKEFDALEKILKPEQRTKLHELLGEGAEQQSPAPAK